MVLERKQVTKALKKKGFEADTGTGDNKRDHDFFHLLDRAGRKSAIFTKTSRGNKYKTLGDPLVAAMARQLRLTKDQFVDLVKCPLSKEAYAEIVFGPAPADDDEDEPETAPAT